ncbi:hypothetical protein RGQ29_017938 [Quercus rubra]|uniref:TF-B3 domain-containing protein n=1 Tax=Quercus rubra TaxID=3512 RepID=A0AAN7IYF2_QUERU|nr:hypothetical protein RGQ29_017938 [Quercus rubra]
MASYQRRDNWDGPTDLTTKATHFFKIIMPGTLEEGKLLIPKKFIKKYGVELGSMAFLTIPNGTKWTMKLTKRDGEVWFQNVFRYEGNSGFSVLIFDATAAEIEYPLDDQPQVHRMEDNEREKPPLPCTLPHKRAKTKPTSSDLQVGDTGFRHEGLKSKESMLEKCRPVISSWGWRKSSRMQKQPKDGGAAENLVRANALKLENPLFKVVIHPSYVNGKDRALQVVDRLWPMKLYIYSGKYRSCIVSAGWSTFVRENSLQVGVVCIFELNMMDNVVFKVHIFKFVD